MTPKNVVFNFAWLYPLVLIAGAILSRLIGIKPSGIQFALLFATVVIVVERFGKKSMRYFERDEENHVLFGIFGVHMLYQFLGLGLIAYLTELTHEVMLYTLPTSICFGFIGVYFGLKLSKSVILKNKSDES